MPNRDEGPVYYREIQKNAFLKRIPDDTTSKLRPLVQKKPPLKPMWTLFCVHNGKTPYLEQYPQQESSLTHRPTWRACLKTARHVTASVKPHSGQEYDFLIDTDNGPVRMLAPDWESMQDWVATLRNKLHELRILTRGENVYGAGPVVATPRAPARDPTSPLPPTPPVPPDRVPGIELTPIRPNTETQTNIESVNSNSTGASNRAACTVTDTNVRSVGTVANTNFYTNKTLANIANNNAASTVASTSANSAANRNLSTLNINKFTAACGANTSHSNTNVTVTCTSQSSTVVDKYNSHSTVTSINTPFTCSLANTSKPISTVADTFTNFSLEKALNEIQRSEIDISSWDEPPVAMANQKITKAKICGQNICLDDSILKRTACDEDSTSDANESDTDFTQMLSVNEENSDSVESPPQSNVTVIKVSNKPAPHTAIPVLGPPSDVFDFNFKQNLTINQTKPDIVNIINTNDRYGTVFDPEPQYGHISLTTTVSLTGEHKMADATANDSVYERLCMASTSNASPLSIRRLRNGDKNRKSSLPNLETDYECLFPSSSENNLVNGVNTTEVSTLERRTNVERSQSQNAYDVAPRARENIARRVQNDTKPDIKSGNTAQKPIWRRGLTELSLLTRLKSIKQGRRQDSPTRCENNGTERVSSPQKVVRRARTENRVDSSRRRSNSLSNGEVAPSSVLVPLRTRQAAALRAEQRRGACVTTVPVRDAPLFVDYDNRIWIARWGCGGARCAGRAGDALAALGALQPISESHARQIIHGHRKHMIDVLFYRVPLAKIFVITKKDNEHVGIKLDNECTIQSIEANSPASRVGFPPGKWAVTEVNNRPINLVKGGEEEMNRLSARGTEVSILIQPSALVKKIRAAVKSNRPLLGIR
ncbi:uncharacterized protein LOC126973576 [Leptidea sinapis]|uniref:uncharacterized protein LOC126973576 n=1 Tax=Leptidea sinapis TaxID=189913 RepID=UPI0021C379D3|nr:uncharacterized protein LOC126973576 [Leptidea sinapis]